MNRSPGMPVAIVLGGTFPHVELVNKLKSRNYYVILADYLFNPPAKQYAHEHVQISTLDKDAVLELAISRAASLVISVAIDQANVTAAYVSGVMGLPHPYSHDTALSVTNKKIMKTMMANNGIPTSKFLLIQDSDYRKIDQLRFPVIVKPVDSNSSKGISRVNSMSDLGDAIKFARQASRVNEVIVEEFVIGKEVGVDFIISQGVIKMTSSRERIKINHKNDNEQQIIGSIWPSDTVAKNENLFLDIAYKIKEAFSLNNTPFFVQAIIRNDEIFVIELAARIGGGNNYQIVRKLNGYNLIDAGVKSFLGEQLSLAINSSLFYHHDCYLYARHGVIGSIKGLDDLLNNGIIEDYTIYKNKGEEVRKELSSNNRVGTFSLKSKTVLGLINKRKQAIESILIENDFGEDILLRDLYDVEQ